MTAPARRGLLIAIDGPSGAGKGTVARAVARRFGLRHVDTGAMYRAVAWAALRQGVPLDDEPVVAALAERAHIILDGDRTHIDGHDVSRDIRTPAIDVAAAAVARLPRVRAVLVERQRAYAEAGGLVMEGRDIGTVVLPDADLKIFLDADPSERARRRASDPAHASRGSEVAAVASALDERDASDRTRTASPLARADDAVLIDTTTLAVDTVVERVAELVAALIP